MAEPIDIAREILSNPKKEQLRAITRLLEMIQAAIVIRSACRDKFFISMNGKEDSGTKFDRLLKEEFGMTWQDKPEKSARSRKRSR